MNILITGTPGTGKTTICNLIQQKLEDQFEITHLNISEIIKQHKLYQEFDEEFDTWLFDENLLLDWFEENILSEQNKRKINLIDFHSCSIFPQDWIDQVYVITSNTESLFDRLQARKYSAKKINENMECEIMQVVLEEATEHYEPQIKIQTLMNNDFDELDKNIDIICNFITNKQAQIQNDK